MQYNKISINSIQNNVRNNSSNKHTDIHKSIKKIVIFRHSFGISYVVLRVNSVFFSS